MEEKGMSGTSIENPDFIIKGVKQEAFDIK